MRRRGPLLVGIASGVVAVLVLVLLVLPKMGEVGKARDDLVEAQEQQSALEAQLGSLQEAKEQAPEVEEELKALQTLMPPTVELPALIRLIAQAADRSAVDFFSIAPGPPAADGSGAFSIVPTQITVNGEFFALEEFMYSLETLPRAAKVMSFAVTQGPDFTDGGSDEVFELTVVMAAEFYTTDASAGPGSIAGPTEGAAGAAPPPSTGA